MLDLKLLLIWALQVFENLYSLCILLRCWMLHHKVQLDFPILIVRQEILASQRLSSMKQFFLCGKMSMHNHIQCMSGNLSVLNFVNIVIVNNKLIILIAQNHFSRFTIAVVNYHTFDWMINSCHHNCICIAWGRPYNKKLIVARLI